MLIPSIDLMNGEAVQLVGGATFELSAGDPRPIMERFARVGEVALVDLDAALGRGSNESVLQDLLRIGNGRVGGGIRSKEGAIEWLDRGAQKIVLGTAATPEFLRELPQRRLIAALDSVQGEVVVEGWVKKTGRTVTERMRELRDLVDGFLVTFVEREGRLEGVDFERVRELREAAGSARLTVAGGIRSTEEIRQLDEMGIDAQLGMALYKGKLSLAEAFAAPFRSDRTDGLWPTVVCTASGEVLGQVYSSLESLTEALNTGTGVYASRKRGLWRKGETSGNRQQLERVYVDCDRDALLFVVSQAGEGFCHLPQNSCFGTAAALASLERVIANAKERRDAVGYTARLLREPLLLNQKLREEARELAEASEKSEVIHEAADLFYFAMVTLGRAGVSLCDVEDELQRRSLRVTRRGGEAKGELP